MQDYKELFKNRQSCRGYDGRPVEHEKLVAIMEAALQTPSACNSQPWSFVVVEDPKLLPEVAKCCQSFDNNPWADGCGAFVVVLEEPAKLMSRLQRVIDSQYFAKGDLGAATYGITLAAEGEGVASCIMGTFDRPALRQLLDIPGEKQVFMVVGLGYPKDPKIRDKSRKGFDEVVRFL